MTVPVLVEAELRSFVSKEQYRLLLDRFGHEGDALGERIQETLYLHGPYDLRLQKTTTATGFEAKLILNGGTLHDTARDEQEVLLTPDDFPSAIQLFAAIGFPVELAWRRVRHTFRWHDTDVTIDDTRDYGYVLALERKGPAEEVDAALTLLRAQFAELGVEITPRDAFDRAYASYKERNRRPHASRAIPEAQPSRLCVCGHSKTMPYCDGTHSEIEAGDGPKMPLEEWFEKGNDEAFLDRL